MDDETAITREDAQEIFGALADISSDTLRIRMLLDDPDLEEADADDEAA